MRILLAVLLILALVVIAGLVWIETSFATYVYRYRLVISVLIDNQPQTASSVIEVTAQSRPFGVGSATLRGQAPFLDLGPRGVAAFSLMENFGEHYLYGSARSALSLAAAAFGNHGKIPDYPELPRLSGRRELPTENVPVMVWFPNPNDQSTGRTVLPDNLSSVFDPNARVVAAHVEITSDPVAIDIDKKLPWYEKWEAGIVSRPHTQIIKLADGRQISKYHLLNKDRIDPPSFATRVAIVMFLLLDPN